MALGTYVALRANGKRTDIVSQFYSELFRIGAAASDLGVYQWMRSVYVTPGAFALVFGLIGQRRRPSAPTQ
ncbi:MAG TPA: hypothetical protein VIA18_26535 [Polyangia bacterium]|nr:hypothetical protein [Polyangia bacterium]